MGHDTGAGESTGSSERDDTGAEPVKLTPVERPRVPITFDDPTPWPGLTQAEDTWARIYAKTGSAREACAHAGMVGSATAHTRKLMVREEIRNALGVYTKMCAHAFSVQREAIVAQLARIGFADIADLYDPDTGEVLPPHRLPARVRAAVSSVTTSVDLDGTISTQYQLTPRVKALELLTRVLGMGEQKGQKPLRVRMVANPVSGEVSAEVQLATKG